MDWTLKIEKEESPVANRLISIYTYLSIDEVNSSLIIDIKEWFNILDSGVYPLFMCCCGDFQCNGAHVEISRIPSGYSIQRIFNQELTMPKEVTLLLDWDDVIIISKEIIDSIRNAGKDNFEVCCGTMGDDLFSEIEHFSNKVDYWIECRETFGG